jgi:hypothetical protein
MFEGLKFTDIILPAVGGIASAYSPYTARGINTGMNIFNSLASFQSDIQYWKRLKEEREKEDLAADELRRGYDEYLNTVEGWTNAEKDNIARSVRADISNDEETPQAAISPVGGPLSWPMQGVIPEGAKFGDLVPQQVINQRVTEELPGAMAGSQDLRALEERQAALRFGRNAIPASPGGAAQLGAVLSEQAHGGAIERARLQQLLKDQEINRMRDYQIAEVNRQGLLEDELQLMAERQKNKLEGYEVYGALQKEVMAAGDDPEGIPTDKLISYELRASEAVAKLRENTSPEDKAGWENVKRAERLHRRLSDELTARSQKPKPNPDPDKDKKTTEGVGNSLDRQRSYEDALVESGERLRALGLVPVQ